MHIILKIIYGLGMGCFYLYQWLLPEPPSEINYSFHAFFLAHVKNKVEFVFFLF